tara:strand:- start:397 stop:555 length:159 start_codon:yes stop_codon:yes gene_type:complete
VSSRHSKNTIEIKKEFADRLAVYVFIFSGLDKINKNNAAHRNRYISPATRID